MAGHRMGPAKKFHWMGASISSFRGLSVVWLLMVAIRTGWRL
jgi:hypothetical protein